MSVNMHCGPKGQKRGFLLGDIMFKEKGARKVFGGNKVKIIRKGVFTLV